MKNRFRPFRVPALAAAFAACAFAACAFAAVPCAAARELQSSNDLTFFGTLVFEAGNPAAVFVPQNPPVLLSFRHWDDGSLELAATDAGGKENATEFFLADVMGGKDSPMAVFASPDGSSFVFVSRESGFVEVDVFPGKGVALAPLDAGDTREARRAETAGGAVPELELSRLEEIDVWLVRRFGGSPAASAAPEAVSAVSKGGVPSPDSGDGRDSADFGSVRTFGTGSLPSDPELGNPIRSGLYTQWGKYEDVPRLPRGVANPFQYVKRPRTYHFDIRENGLSLSRQEGDVLSYPFRGSLEVGGRTFRIYEFPDGSEHVAVAPDGEIVLFVHLPGIKNEVYFFDAGDTRERRLAELMQTPARFPGFPVPETGELAKWCFAQPVSVPPGMMPGRGPANRAGCIQCKGTGRIKRVVAGYGKPEKCPECGEASNHIHLPCPACN